MELLYFLREHSSSLFILNALVLRAIILTIYTVYLYYIHINKGRLGEPEISHTKIDSLRHLNTNGS